MSHTAAVTPALRSPVELCDPGGAGAATQDGDAHVAIASQRLQLLHNPPAFLQKATAVYVSDSSCCQIRSDDASLGHMMSFHMRIHQTT